MISILIFIACQQSSIKNTVISTNDSSPNPDTTDSSQLEGFDWDSVNVDRASEHLAALQEIADENDGNRAAGTSGYDASVVYVSDVLTAAGYAVTEWPFSFSQYQLFNDPELSVNGNSYSDIAVLYYSPAGDIEAPVYSVNLTIPPGSDANSSSSGCNSNDFASFPAGAVALIQRGTCTFKDKVENAQAAGAVGVIIFNEGQNGRQDVVDGTLGDPSGLSIPVLGASFAVGEAIAGLEGGTVKLVVDSATVEVESVNVFAERSVGDPSNKIVVGAHLDSVIRGPGINDNGSGVASQLALAEQLNSEGHIPNQRIQFAFWGAEELGLIGSYRYIESLSEQERGEIRANLNFDMVASPNYVRFIYDGDGSSFGEPGPSGSDLIEERFEQFYDALDMPYEATSFDGRSDYGPFIMVGIPAGGLFSGAEGIKTESELDYGGIAGEAYDKCYHQNCDDLQNINMDSFREMMGAMFEVTRWASESDDLLQSSKSQRSQGPMQLDKRGCHFIR